MMAEEPLEEGVEDQVEGPELGTSEVMLEVRKRLEQPATDLSELFEPDDIEQGAVRAGENLPGDKEGQVDLGLSDEEEALFARELMGMLESYDTAMRGRREREEDIEAQYALADDYLTGGTTADAEHLTSEFLMAQVDQACARLEENVLGARPLVKVDPIIWAGDGEQIDYLLRMATSTQRFMNSFLKHDAKLDRKFPVILHRAAKVGTCVIHPWWIRRTETQRYWGDHGRREEEQREYGGIELTFPANRHVICWPPNKVDWQECSIVGHRFFLTQAELRTYATTYLGLDEEEIEQILSRQPDDDRRFETIAQNDQGIAPSGELQQFVGHIKLTQLYFYLVLPGQDKPINGYCILHEDTQEILYLDANRFFRQRFPYFPVRYKIIDEASWGMGIGDEIIQIQAADSAMRNLQMDNLMAGAFNLVQVRAGSMADVTIDRPLPGQMVPVDEPGEDIVATPMGGKAEGLDESIQANRFFGREATGLAPVLGGQGDPTMKSGAGTGSTLALIEQAGKKFGAVDRKMRDDLSDFFAFSLELVTQYAPEGLFYRWASEEDADVVEMVRYTPVRGVVENQMRIYASAPNASTSREGRHQQLMVFWQFINQHAQLMLQMAGEVMGKTNPAAFERYQLSWVEFLDRVAHEIAHTIDIPGLPSMMPELPEPLSTDERMNQLMQQMQQAQQKLMQAQQQLQMMQMQMAQGGAPPGMPPGPPGPPGPQRPPGPGGPPGPGRPM